MPDRAGVGGTHTHKPDCRCRPCKAREREAEAIARRTGNLPAAPVEDTAINADLPPKFKTTRKNLRFHISRYVAFRATEPNLSNADIARRMGIAPNSLTVYLKRAVEQGILRFDDPIDKLEHEIIPKTLNNLSEFLDNKDKQVTIEVAKGTLFPLFREAKGLVENRQNTVLAIKFENMPQVQGPSKDFIGPVIDLKPIGSGTVVGTPKSIPANV
jgi:hypothetical protein